MKIIFTIKPDTRHISLLEILEDIRCQCNYQGDYAGDRSRMLDKIGDYITLIDGNEIVIKCLKKRKYKKRKKSRKTKKVN